MSRSIFFSAGQIKDLISVGQQIVIYDGYVLRLDSWLDQHPGGKLVILHMVGRDATCEINAYHNHRTRLLMKPFRIGRLEKPWVNIVPPTQGGQYVRDIQKEELLISDGSEKFGDSIACTGYASKPLNPSDCNRNTKIAAIEERETIAQVQAYPAVDDETQRAICAEYETLHERIRKDGFYVCRYSEYAKEGIRYAALFGAFLFFLIKEHYLVSSVFLGMFWHQIMFVAHDAGHRGITGNLVSDTLIGTFVADFCCGLSIGWWKQSHNVHHLVTNMPEHDPDLQNVPLFSTSPTYFKSIISTFYGSEFTWDAAADRLVAWQKWTYYPVMALARFNLYALSWWYLLIGSQRAQPWVDALEIAFMLCYWTIFGYGLVWCTLPDWPTRIGFVVISHASTMLLHVQITLSHWGMPTSNLGPIESFPQHQLRTTMDVECPEWLDWLHGGLQFQAVHHLFPRVPRHNLRSLQVLVKEFCSKTQVQYKCFSFIEGNKVVLGRLEEVAAMITELVQPAEGPIVCKEGVSVF
ncbi:fatty acid/sphingolipid desaturase [Pseudovirgaria hyperparasitica]|uniref:Delta 8-(E)-sphingolipid desaturase n=1 Tax=Pseudovirgaria hyperparasitica TaxID=470096 RepID=A0A6A6W8X3_9PEZI|nr:fatty acid/sphingolipid desaturase [Pseudovirgaria hyperparasitica]KAF2758649.1 fatty acid/sphingolipid desaturase [Pseudovirgaria hyperparasitica]